MAEYACKSVTEKTSDGIIVFTKDGSIISANDSIAELFQCTKNNLLEMKIHSLINKANLDTDPIRYDLLDEGLTVRKERLMKAPNGTEYFVELCSTRIPGGNYQSIIRDIGKRKVAECELQKARALLESALEQCPIGVVIHECPSGKPLLANKAATTITKTPLERLCTLNLDLIEAAEEKIYDVNGSVIPFEKMPLSRAILHGEIVSGTKLIVRYKDGSESTLSISAAPIKDESGKPFAAISIFSDITESMRAEALLKKRTDTLHTIFENINLGILLVRPDLRVSAYNRHFLEMVGLPNDFLDGHPEIDKLINYWIERTKPTQSEIDRVRRDALRQDSFSREFAFNGRTFEFRHSPLADGGFVRTLSDISDRKRAEEERIRNERAMLHTQKLESLGILAGGIAHDFNNLLLAILGNIELAKIHAGETNEELAKRLSDAENAALRASDLTRQLLAYSGKGKCQLKNFSLTSLVSEMASLLNVSISKKAELNLKLENDLPAMEGDPVQVQQVIMNLIVNASESLDGKDGKISISTGLMDCSPEILAKSKLDKRPKAGRFVFFEVKDTGCGMDEETEKRLFEPFFTTKVKGRGLGMSAVLGIMRSHGGAIFLDSVKGKGSSFKMLFPISGKAIGESAENPACSNSSQNATIETHGCILVVDDEAMIRELCVAIMAKIGLKTITASNGTEAIELYKSHGREISCVLLDVSMPGMDGPTVFKKLKEIDPSVKIALSSGYSHDDIANRFQDIEFEGFIQKPFQIDQLRNTLRTLLGQ